MLDNSLSITRDVRQIVSRKMFSQVRNRFHPFSCGPQKRLATLLSENVQCATVICHKNLPAKSFDVLMFAAPVIHQNFTIQMLPPARKLFQCSKVFASIRMSMEI
ncbi:uncharacterized protein LOC131687932 [Topomyia yanbarensis]|uniref:uncharacterized protein LOC131687932 n=1 Tax=Topomyia yanbarensis TaxID=2498891 RepID=UPI00273C731F|nr:uncharacterized protein LOC131687932 [Topomyia yanbarensis]